MAIAFSYAKERPYVLVLGIAQDGGMPHAGCIKSCCKDLWKKPEKHLKVSAIAIIDPETEQSKENDSGNVKFLIIYDTNVRISALTFRWSKFTQISANHISIIISLLPK